MLMADMKQGDTARITKCHYPAPGQTQTQYLDVIVLRMYVGHGWAFLAPSHHCGNGFMEGAGPSYEVEPVQVEIRTIPMTHPIMAKNQEPLIDMGPGWRGNTPNGPWEGD